MGREWLFNRRMEEIKRVDSDTLARWERLADQVRNELMAARIAVVGDLDQGGAEVEVDPFDDGAGGVFLAWHAHPRLENAAVQCVQEQRFDAAPLRHSGTVSQAMRDAMSVILTSAGYTVKEPNTDFRPLELQIVAGPAGCDDDEGHTQNG